MAQHAKMTGNPLIAALKEWSPLHAVLISALFVGLLGMTFTATMADSAGIGVDSEQPRETGDGLSDPEDVERPEGFYLDPIFNQEIASQYADNLNVENASGEAVVSLFTVDAAAEPLTGEGAAASSTGATSLSSVEAGVAAFADEGFDVGFVMLDMQTGKGLSYNADGIFFSASTVKASYVTFVSQNMLDTGADSKDAELEEAILYDGGGVLATDDQSVYTLEEVITYTIENSDNNGYGMLRDRYELAGFEAWVQEAGVSADIATESWYPYYSPRDLAKLWLKTQSYFDSDAENAAWCESLFSQTQLSFIRDAIGDHAEVHAKAGYEISGAGGGYWYYDWWSGMTLYGGGDYSLAALNDAGIVSTESGDYLLVVLTNADFDEYSYTDNEPKMVTLIQALDAARSELLVS